MIMAHGTKSSKRRVTAHELGINVGNRSERTLFHWFMCVILFAKPVQQEIAGNAFRVLKKHGYDSPDALESAGWQRIVDALGEAQYVRYDESTATRLLDASRMLKEQYDGRVHTLVNACDSAATLKRAIQKFKGIGPTGAEIFLREVGPVYYGK